MLSEVLAAWFSDPVICGTQATTAKRAQRARSDARMMKGGEETEDLGDGWSERETKLPKSVEPLRFKKVVPFPLSSVIPLVHHD